MGNILSQSMITPVNYNCHICMKKGNDPNIAGRFFIINADECQCNGCKSVFPKNQIYKPVITDAKCV